MAEVTEPRHSFYETDDKLTLEIFDKGVDPEQVKIAFQPRAFTYENGETKKLVLQPLKGEIDPEASTYTIGKVKVEIKFAKRAAFRWGALTGDSPDILSTFAPPPTSAPEPPQDKPRPQHKNWEKITTEVLSSEKEKDPKDDPNVSGDSTVNGFFQQLFGDADENTKRAMMKSYYESGGTTLSTNWEEVSKGKVEVKPPQGSEWKRWG